MLGTVWLGLELTKVWIDGNGHKRAENDCNCSQPTTGYEDDEDRMEGA